MTELVVPAALGLVLLQVLFRGWALYGSWFYLDDYSLVMDARDSGLDRDYLLEPFNSHLMPGGRLAAYWISLSGVDDWFRAATMLVVLQALASLACLWMLISFFGRRFAVLAPLIVYLTSALTVPSLMWWTAAVNQLPVHLALFLALGAWVRYLRDRRLVWLSAAVLAVLLGLFFDVRALLIVPVMVAVSLAYFSQGGPVRRVLQALRRYWPAVVLGAVLAGGYLAYYTSAVQQPFTETTAKVLGDTANFMLGTAFPSGLVGGPWRWTDQVLYADPPLWTQHLSWVVVFAVVVASLLRRRRAARGWLILAGFVLLLYGLLVTSRAPAFGADIGLDYRFMADATGVAVLALGLAFLEVPGAVESSTPRDEPLLHVGSSPGWPVLLTALVAASGVYSTVAFLDDFDRANVGRSYLTTLSRELSERTVVDLADQAVPASVMSPLTSPDNSLAELVPLLSPHGRFPATSDSLAVVDDEGRLHQALIGPGVRSEPGPLKGCGWKVTDRGRTIPLEGRAFDYQWWLRIGYLAGQESPLTVHADDTTLDATILDGLNNLYVRMDGSFDEVTLDGLDPDVVMCVDVIEVGPAVPGGPLP